MESRYVVLKLMISLTVVALAGCASVVAEPAVTPTAPPTPIPTDPPPLVPTEGLQEDEGMAVEGWVGTVIDLPAGNQFGQLFRRDDGEEYGLGTPTAAVREQVSEARGTGARVKVWGTLYTGAPADQARTIEVERMEIVSTPEGEQGGQPVEGWTGTVYKLPQGNQFGRSFVRDDGERYGIGAANDALRQQISEAAWTSARIQVWGRLHTGVPATEARHIEIDRIEILSDAAPEARDLTPFAEVTASSFLPSDRYGSYAPYAAVDGLNETAWVEGVSGPGMGEWIQLTFPGTIELRALVFDVGFNKSADLFAKNNRIKSATVVFSDGERTTVDFADARGPQEIAMVRAPGPNVETTFVKIIIDEVYSGTTYDDTCLAEIQVWGVVK